MKQGLRKTEKELNAQMEKDSLWIVVYRSPSHTSFLETGTWTGAFKQRDEFEAQIQWLISSVRQRRAKGCFQRG